MHLVYLIQKIGIGYQDTLETAAEDRLSGMFAIVGEILFLFILHFPFCDGSLVQSVW